VVFRSLLERNALLWMLPAASGDNYLCERLRDNSNATSPTSYHTSHFIVLFLFMHRDSFILLISKLYYFFF
jgi:hypothetical protein